MSYRCATCGGNHRKPETARRCAEQQAARGSRERAANYDHWATSGRAEQKSEDWAQNEYGDSPIVPNGHYFIPTEQWSPKGIHVHFQKFDEGRWAHVWFVKAFDEDGKPELQARLSDREFVHAKLSAAGPIACMVEYGKLYSRCGVCNEELTEDEREETGGHAECLAVAFKLVSN
jgi:hypothetical protein